MGTATSEREQIEGGLTAFEDRDAATASEFWAEDGVFIDPQYPESEYRGPDEIRGRLSGRSRTSSSNPDSPFARCGKDISQERVSDSDRLKCSRQDAYFAPRGSGQEVDL